VYRSNGDLLAKWPDLSDISVLTGIAVTATDVFVADAGSRVVWRLDKNGKVLGEIGQKDPQRGIPGFIIPSGYFDLAIAPNRLLCVANPGRRLMETYMLNGDLQSSWGRSGNRVEAFCGCCNPANFAILPDGHFITVEKGLVRVKEYDPEGALVGVVAGPEQLVPPDAGSQVLGRAFDVAVDAGGRIFVLDRIRNSVRVFTKKAK
jgi:hypothetical protein